MSNEKKIDWMYEGAKSSVNREDYLLGKKVDKNFEKYSDVVNEEKPEQIDSLVKTRTVISAQGSSGLKKSTLQTEIIRSEDPFVAVRVREETKRREMMDNPLMKMKLQKMLKSMMNSSKEETKKKKKSKKRRDSSEESDEDERRRRRRRSEERSSRRKRSRSRSRSRSGERRRRDERRRERSPARKRSRSRSSSREDQPSRSRSGERRRRDERRRERSPARKRSRSRSSSREDQPSRSRSGERRRRDERRRERSPARKRSRSRSSSPEDQPSTSTSRNRRNSEENSKNDKKYGLIEMRKRSKSPESAQKPVKEYKLIKFDTGRGNNKAKLDKSRPAPRSKLSDEEKAEKLREMQENAKWRDAERQRNLVKNREENEKEKRELDEKGYAPSFIRNQMRAACDDLTVEKHIASKKSGVQRSHGYMNQSFARK